MAKVRFSRVSGTTNIDAALNSVIQKIEEEFSNAVLYRQNPSGESNTMFNDLDMGGYDILNTGSIAGEKIVIGTMPLIEVLENAVYQTIVNPDDPFEVHDGIEKFATTVTDIDALESSGWFYTNTPPVGTGSGWLLVFALGSGLTPSGTTLQMYVNHSLPVQIWTRFRSGSTWTIWTEYGSRVALETHLSNPSAHPEVVALIDADMSILADDIATNAADIAAIEAVDVTQNSRLDELEDDLVLATVNTNSIPLSTTPVTVNGNTTIVSDGITLNGDGSVTYTKPGRYVVSWSAKVAVSGSCTVYNWLEKWNGSTWDAVPYSGFARTFGSVNEVEIAPSYLRSVTVANEMYRIRMSASNSSASLTSVSIPSGALMPSFRLDIRK